MTLDASTGRNFGLKVSAFVMPKAGSAANECEDSVGVDRRRMKFCLADGATEAFDSRTWARLLTKAWVRASGPIISRQDFAAWLPAAGDRMHSRWENRRLSWYSEEKSRAGTFAAFAGLTFENSDGKLLWTAAALGDACIFRRGESGSLEDAVPDLAGDGFDRRPMLIPSKRSLQPGALSEMQFLAGTVKHGDVFLLLTDSIAAWYLRRLEDDPALAARFDSLVSEPHEVGLETLMTGERERGTLRNDDVAAIRIEYGGSGGESGVAKRGEA